MAWVLHSTGRYDMAKLSSLNYWFKAKPSPINCLVTTVTLLQERHKKKTLILSCYLLALNELDLPSQWAFLFGRFITDAWFETHLVHRSGYFMGCWSHYSLASGTAPNWLPSPCQPRHQWVISRFIWHSVPPSMLLVLACKSTIFSSDFWFLLGGIVCTGGSLKSHWDGHVRALSE